MKIALSPFAASEQKWDYITQSSGEYELIFTLKTHSIKYIKL